MTYDETIGIMSVLKAAYPAYYKGMSKRDAVAAVQLWSQMLADEPVEVVAMAVKARITGDARGFPPGIGEIQQEIDRLRFPDRLGEAEAWVRVRRAISNGLYGSQQEFDRLPDEVKGVVGGPEQIRAWAAMESETVDSVVASNFRRAYRAHQEEATRQRMLPPDVKQMAKALASGMTLDGYLKQIGDGGHGMDS